MPGYWLEKLENGYTKLVRDTYQLVKAKKGFSDHWQRFFEGESVNLIQCAEQLQKPVEILNKTYSNCTWQNETLDAARGIYGNCKKLTELGSLFGLSGYPTEVQNNGDKITKTALQYLENHESFSRSLFVRLVALCYQLEYFSMPLYYYSTQKS